MIPDPLAVRSPRLGALFSWWVRGYVARHFHAVRVARDAPLAVATGPLLVVLNHASWWDPLVGAVLAPALGARAHLAPIEAKALARYPFLERLGLFPLDASSARGRAAFLRAGTALLARDDVALWLTAQGRFADARERPPGLRPGVGHLARRMRRGTILPLALEYVFWDERTPEVLVAPGAALVLDGATRRTARAWTSEIERRLADAQDALAALAVRRDAAAFRTLLAGRAGVGGVYDAWRRLRALVRREPFAAEHGASLPWRAA